MDRAKLRINGAWRATRRLSLALEINPGEDEVLPNFNFSPSLPGEHVKGVGLITGTSSDRIGTPDGRAWFSSLTLDPRSWGVDIPLTAYAGASYGTYQNDLRAIGGFYWSLTDHISAGLQHDGEQLHAVGSYAFGELGPGHATWSLDLLWVEVLDDRYFGVTVSTRF